jgi:hypothetical protein
MSKVTCSPDSVGYNECGSLSPASAQGRQPPMLQLLVRMERDVIVRVRPNPHDGRGNLMSLTGPFAGV